MRDGPAAVRNLNGMFAIAIATRDGAGLVARDPMGVKPLYWVDGEHGALFASELRAFDVATGPQVTIVPARLPLDPERGVVRYANAVPVEVRPARRAQHEMWDDVVLKRCGRR